MSRIKQYRKGSWYDVDFLQRRGGKWVNIDVYQYLKGKWVKITAETYTRTWDCTWTQTYRQAGTKRTDYRSEKLCQGRYVYEPWGIMRSLAGFGDIRSTISGAKIKDVKIYLKNEHWYYYSGGKVKIGYHNHSSRPSTFSESRYGEVTSSYSSRGQAKWIDMPNSFGEGIRDGRYNGFSVFANTGDMNYYGIFSGENDGSSKPKIKITYVK